MKYSILPMLPDYWEAVREIYTEGIATGNATFETEVPDWEKWDEGHRKDCRLVAVDNKVLGWAALRLVSARHVYRGVAEVSVYVAAAARGRGVGKALLEALVEQSEATGSGHCRQESFLRIPPALRSINRVDSAKSAFAETLGR